MEPVGLPTREGSIRTGGRPHRRLPYRWPAAAIAGLAILAISLAFIISGGESPAQQPTGSSLPRHDAPVDLHPVGSGEGWTAQVAGTVPEFAVPLLNWASGSLDLVDRGSGEARGRLQVGAYPLAVIRHVQDEVIVSDMFTDQSGNIAFRILVFDARSLALKRILPMRPERTTYAIYASAMVLSADEQWLIYSTRGTDSIPECAGSAQAASCDVWSAVAVRLDSVDLVETSTELPKGCGWVHFSTGAEGSTIASCTDGDSFRLNVTNQILSAQLLPRIDPPLESEPLLKGRPSRVLSANLLADGTQVKAFASGILMTRSQSGIINSYRIVPDGTRPVSSIEVTILSSGRVAVAFGTNPASGAGDGYSVFDVGKDRTPRFTYAQAVTSLVVEPDGTIQAVLRDDSLVIDRPNGPKSPIKLIGTSGGDPINTAAIP